MAFARGSNPRGVACEIVACLVGMVLGVQLARLIAVVLRMEVVRMGVVGGLFVMAGRMRRGCSRTSTISRTRSRSAASSTLSSVVPTW